MLAVRKLQRTILVIKLLPIVTGMGTRRAHRLRQRIISAIRQLLTGTDMVTPSALRHHPQTILATPQLRIVIVMAIQQVLIGRVMIILGIPILLTLIHMAIRGGLLRRPRITLVIPLRHTETSMVIHKVHRNRPLIISGIVIQNSVVIIQTQPSGRGKNNTFELPRIFGSSKVLSELMRICHQVLAAYETEYGNIVIYKMTSLVYQFYLHIILFGEFRRTSLA